MTFVRNTSCVADVVGRVRRQPTVFEVRGMELDIKRSWLVKVNLSFIWASESKAWELWETIYFEQGKGSSKLSARC